MITIEKNWYYKDEDKTIFILYMDIEMFDIKLLGSPSQRYCKFVMRVNGNVTKYLNLLYKDINIDKIIDIRKQNIDGNFGDEEYWNNIFIDIYNGNKNYILNGIKDIILSKIRLKIDKIEKSIKIKQSKISNLENNIDILVKKSF